MRISGKYAVMHTHAPRTCAVETVFLQHDHVQGKGETRHDGDRYRKEIIAQIVNHAHAHPATRVQHTA